MAPGGRDGREEVLALARERVDWSALVARAGPSRLVGGAGACEVRPRGPEDTLLFLCLHGTKHDWALGWLVDVWR